MSVTNIKPPRDQAKKADVESGKTEYKDLHDGAITGNLTRDPELRYTPAGRAIASLRVASSERTQDPATGEWRDQGTVFSDVVVWGEQGERVAEYLRKADRIVAMGVWQEQRWTDNEGKPRDKVILVAREIGPSFLFKVPDLRSGRR